MKEYKYIYIYISLSLSLSETYQLICRSKTYYNAVSLSDLPAYLSHFARFS